MRKIQFAALALIISCGSNTLPTAPTETSTMKKICDPFESSPVQGGEYIVQNNVWNSNLPQCLELGAGVSFRVTANHDKPRNGPPASYPSVFKGCHWGNCTQQNPLPIQVQKLASAVSSFDTTQPEAGAYNVAYDIWYNTVPTTSGQPDGAELMIWLAHRGGIQPAGNRIASVNIGGDEWEVWTMRMNNWNYIAYVHNGNIRSVTNLDIKAFTGDAVSHGAILPSWYLITVEAGFEIWNGGQGLGVNSFSFAGS